MKELVLGFDCRVHPETLSDTLNELSQKHFLLRPDISYPLTVDSLIWPGCLNSDRLYDAASIGNPLEEHIALPPHAPVATLSDLMKILPTGTPAHFIVAQTLVVHEAAILQDAWWGAVLDPSQHYEIPSSCWNLLGYDVADSGHISGLCNCQYEDQELATLSAAFCSDINDYGLFKTASAATAFRDKCDARVPEHSPFYVYEIYHINHDPTMATL